MSLTGVAIIIIHHVGRGFTSKDTSYAGRGASAVGDWAHNTFLLRTIDHKIGTLELSCQKSRNFQKPDPIQLRLNQNLVFERVYQKGGHSQVNQQSMVTNALIGLGGSANTQTLLIAEVVKNNPFLNPTKAHDIIRDAVASGAVVEGQNGRKKTYNLPKQQQPSLPAVQSVQTTP